MTSTSPALSYSFIAFDLNVRLFSVKNNRDFELTGAGKSLNARLSSYELADHRRERAK